MSYELLDHAFRALQERQLPLMVLDMVMQEPQQIVLESSGRKAYQSIAEIAPGKKVLIRLSLKKVIHS